MDSELLSKIVIPLTMDLNLYQWLLQKSLMIKRDKNKNKKNNNKERV
jgi:hypothetical protein